MLLWHFVHISVETYLAKFTGIATIMENLWCITHDAVLHKHCLPASSEESYEVWCLKFIGLQVAVNPTQPALNKGKQKKKMSLYGPCI